MERSEDEDPLRALSLEYVPCMRTSLFGGFLASGVVSFIYSWRKRKPTMNVVWILAGGTAISSTLLWIRCRYNFHAMRKPLRKLELRELFEEAKRKQAEQRREEAQE